MIGKNVDSEELTSLSEVKEVLEQRKKDGELTYEQQLAYEHAKKFASGERSKEEKFKKALVEAGASPKSAIKIMDIMPKNAMTIRQILMHENRAFTDEEVNKMLATVKENA